MSQPHPHDSDAVLGGQTPPPVNAAVLGGVAGAKQKLAHDELSLSYELVHKLSQTHQLFSFEIVNVNWWGEIVNPTQKKAFYYREYLNDEVSLDMIYIPAGSFMMGAPDDEEGSENFERPQHLVTLSAFHMSRFPITQAQYQSVMMDFHKSKFIGHNLPVDNISWEQANNFCQQLSQKCGRDYTLPSESQWEYACRAGTTTPFYFGRTINTDVVNYDGNNNYGNRVKGFNIYRQKTTEVGQFPPNSFGLSDMHGNIWEWCEDNSHPNYINAPTDGTPWVNKEDLNSHILRGGFWYNAAHDCRSAARSGYREDIEQNEVSTPAPIQHGTHMTITLRPSKSFHHCGLRVVCS
jgi:eukaryotic-like serine/threonine-protein kinase